MRVSDLFNRDSVLLHADMADRDDALGVLVELQESNGVITNGTAYYNAILQRRLPAAAPPSAGASCPMRPARGWRRPAWRR
ncbi:MAG: hypothetical protein ACLUUL_01430 [Gemmiger sp.]